MQSACFSGTCEVGSVILDADKRDADVIGRYRARYGRQDQAFRLLDRVLGALVCPARQKVATPVFSPRRILLVNAGHLGDVIISTALLPVLHHAFPGVEIGYLTGTYSRTVVEGHPLIVRCHFIDHWYQSREATPLWRKFATYLIMIPSIVRELRASRYDVAIDVRSWFPNLIPLLWLVGIPVRVAYDRLGFGPLLTHRLTYDYERRHELDYQLALLRALNISEASLAVAWPTLQQPSERAIHEAQTLLGGTQRYRVLHPMASTPTRDWRLEHWHKLAQKLVKAGITPVITGRGRRERAIADSICAIEPASINAVDALSWAGLLALIERAEAVYAVETSIGHAASAFHRPVVSIYGGMADPVHWAPLGAVVTTKLTPCHPCLNKSGCATRECLMGIHVQDVWIAAETALRGHGRSDSSPVKNADQAI
jgi:ADP-heptose:LPS heptosyltransferase